MARSTMGSKIRDLEKQRIEYETHKSEIVRAAMECSASDGTKKFMSPTDGVGSEKASVAPRGARFEKPTVA